MEKYRLNITVTQETADILKEMADEYASTMGTMVVLLAKNWKVQQLSLKGIELADKMNKDETFRNDVKNAVPRSLLT